MSEQNPRLTLEQAEKVIEQAFPTQGVTISRPKGSQGTWNVTKANGEVIGKAFDLLAACRQAVQPVLKAEAQRRIDLERAKTQEFKDFLQFLRERFNDDFAAWLTARAPAPADGASGSEPRPEQLVQLGA